jgi:hypothetical protein
MVGKQGVVSGGALCDARAAVLLVVLAGCAGGAAPVRMGGFPEAEARAKVAPVQETDLCSVRTGRLVVEVERALVREYPHHGSAPGGRAEQPLIVSVLAPAGEERAGLAEVTAAVAPSAYHAGERVSAFDGRRLLDRPLRAVRGRVLTVRLAENDRTSGPRWATLSESLSGVVGVATLGGLPAPPGSVVSEAIELLRQLDRDDLILLWRIPLDELAARLIAAPTRALRLRMVTTRAVAGGGDQGLPAAELDLAVFREAEPGC